MCITSRVAAGLWLLWTAWAATATADSPSTLPVDPTVQNPPPATQPAEPAAEAAAPYELTSKGPLFYQATRPYARRRDPRDLRDPRTGRLTRGPVDVARLTPVRSRRSAASERSAVRSSSSVGPPARFAANAWDSASYPPWWNRPTNTAETMQKTQYWARRIQPQRWPDRNQRTAILDLWSRYRVQPAGRYQMHAYDTVTGRSAVGFLNSDRTVDFLNPTTGRWYYGVPNRAGGQDWFDPLTGRWVFGVPAGR